MNETPVALIGYPEEAPRALRDLGLLALAVPAEPVVEVLAALRTLRYAGLLVGPGHEVELFSRVSTDALARRVGRVDAVSLAGGAHGTHTLEDTLIRCVEASGYAARGARLLLIGRGVPLRAALGLTRLGVAGVTVAAETRPEAEAALALVPAGVRPYALTSNDPALESLAERADLVVIAGSPPPAGVLQPFHTVIDLDGTARAAAARTGAAMLDLADLHATRLALSLEHVTGQRFRPEVLRDVVATLDHS